MIIRLEFNKNTPSNVLECFFQNPRGTCLSSSSAHHITPNPMKDRGPHISFWFIDDQVLKHYYGGKVSIHSLLTYPRIIRANEILHSEKITLHNLDLDISEQGLVELLEPFL